MNNLDMTDNDSLFNYVVQRSTIGLEDAATNALSFILNRSRSAMQTLSNFLGDARGGPLSIETASPWGADAHGALPDLACRDSDGTVVAFIESKFWAGLTAHQPVTYWKRLPSDRPAVLLFLAPDYRVVHGSLWNELVDRLRDAGHELGPADSEEGTVSAVARVGQRRLMLTSWERLLGEMAQTAEEDGDCRTCFEISELQGLASGVIANERPTRDENLRQLIAEAAERVEQSGWASTDGLRTGEGHAYFARYLRLAGVTAGLRIDYEVVRQMPDRPLWLWFFGEPTDSLSVEEVRTIVGSKAEPGLESCPEDVCVPIVLPIGADRSATLEAMVTELERIAEIIDPHGPTYDESGVTAVDARSTSRPVSRNTVRTRANEHSAIKVVSWNIGKMHQPWRELLEMDADVALLQEVGTVPEDVLNRVGLSPHKPWLSHDPGTGHPNYDRWPMVVRLSDRVRVEWFRQIGPTGVTQEHPGDVAVSGIGTIEVARVIPRVGPEPFIAVSMYARWFGPHPTTEGDWIYSDASAHSIISDLTAFIGYYDAPDKHRILAAGDLNMSFQSTDVFDHRAQTVLDRFRALGLEYLGPQYPAGHRADPVPQHLNEGSLDVPTYYHKPSNTPAGAYAQLDHVFASRGLHKEVRARALNEETDWGSSDHCRISLEVGDDCS